MDAQKNAAFWHASPVEWHLIYDQGARSPESRANSIATVDIEHLAGDVP